MPSGQPPPAHTIAPVGADPQRVAEALAVLRAALGQGYISDERFMRYAAPRAARPYRAALAAADATSGEIVGALTVEIVETRALRDSFMDSYDRALEHAEIRNLQPGRTGLIKSIAVTPESRGSGVATALIQRGLADLAAHGGERCYSLAWERARDGCLLCGALTAAGFVKITRLERFWHQDSVAQGYVCPACGQPCVCAAWVMVRSITPQAEA
jgi:ribosomal protein S18 acetylase RimI-like enzyme